MEDLRELYLETLEAIQDEISQTDEYKQYIQAVNSFKTKLDEQQLIEFEMLMDSMNDWHDEECFSNFVKGFHEGFNKEPTLN